MTYLPDEEMNKVIDTAKKLTVEGYSVIPHLPARTIANNDELEKYIKSLSEESGCSKILVIGGGGNQQGSITSSIEVLETDLLSKYNFEEVIPEIVQWYVDNIDWWNEEYQNVQKKRKLRKTLI